MLQLVFSHEEGVIHNSIVDPPEHHLLHLPVLPLRLLLELMDQNKIMDNLEISLEGLENLLQQAQTTAAMSAKV